MGIERQALDRGEVDLSDVVSGQLLPPVTRYDLDVADRTVRRRIAKEIKPYPA